MSWQYALYKTYDNSLNEIGQINDKRRPLLPLYHTTAVFDIEIIIDEDGKLIKIEKIDTKENTILPCTVMSANARVGSAARPHGLNDNTQYIARDYSRYIPSKADNYAMYLEQITDWVNSLYSHYMVSAVYNYIQIAILYLI